MTDTQPQPTTDTQPDCIIWTRERVHFEKHYSQSRTYIHLLVLDAKMHLTQPRPELN